MKRREVLRCVPFSLALPAGIADDVPARGLHGHSSSGDHDCLAMRYTAKVREMLLWIRKTQAENLLEASYAIARTVKNGGQCWCSWDMGHSTRFDVFPGRHGLPGIFIMGYDPRKTKKGDLFLASIFGGPYEDLVKKDIFVIGAAAPFGGDVRGHEHLEEWLQKRKIRPYSHIWIDKNLTAEGSVMSVPGSAVPFGPVSGIVGMTTFWMMVADACRILSRDGVTVSVGGDEPKLTGDGIAWMNLHDPIMDQYLEQVVSQIEMIEAELGAVRLIAEMAVDSVLAGGSVWCYSRHRGSLASEGYYRMGGLALTRGLCEREGELYPLDRRGPFRGSPKDLVIMGIWEPDDETDLKYLDVFRDYGMKVASIGPMTCNTNIPEGRTVPKETDVHAGRMCDTYGLYAIPGFERKVCPTSGALINQIFWVTAMEIAEQIIRRTGNTPAIFMMEELHGGAAYNKSMFMKYHDRGY